MRRSPPLVGNAVQAFSFLAVMTSFIGTSLSLSETLRTEVPPLLHEAARRLGLEAGAGAAAGGVEAGGSGRGTARGEEEQHEKAAAGAAAVAPAAAAAVSGSGGEHPQQAQQPPVELQDRRGLALALTLVPPLLFTLGRPDAFLGVLEVRLLFLIFSLVERGWQAPAVVGVGKERRRDERRVGGAGGAGSSSAGPVAPVQRRCSFAIGREACCEGSTQACCEGSTQTAAAVASGIAQAD